ncbi:hypothetical protein CJU89_1569 [Yarrowia sp. B02]|nr:hypothetical protein CJU89_1569 [Yarrowia sp. B02]
MECREFISQPKTNHNWNEILRTLEAQRQPFDQLEDTCLVIHIWNGNSTSAACKLLFEKFPHRSYNQWLYRYKNLKEAGQDLEEDLKVPSEVFRKHFSVRFPEVYTERVLQRSQSLSHDKPDRKWYSFAVFEDWAIVLCLSNQGSTPTIIEAARELHAQFPHRTLCAWNNRCRMMIQMSSSEFQRLVEEAKAGYDHANALEQLKKRFPDVYRDDFDFPGSPETSSVISEVSSSYGVISGASSSPGALSGVPGGPELASTASPGSRRLSEASPGPSESSRRSSVSMPTWTLNKPTNNSSGHRLVKENKKIRFTDVENTATYAHIALCQTVQAAARQMAHLFPHRSVRAWDKRMRVLRSVPGWQQTAEVACQQYSYEATVEHLRTRFPNVYSDYQPQKESLQSRADESFLRKARFDEYEDHVVLVHLSLSPTTTATKLHELFPHRTQQAWRQRTLHVQAKVDSGSVERAKQAYDHDQVMRHFRQRFPWVYRVKAEEDLNLVNSMNLSHNVSSSPQVKVESPTTPQIALFQGSGSPGAFAPSGTSSGFAAFSAVSSTPLQSGFSSSPSGSAGVNFSGYSRPGFGSSGSPRMSGLGGVPGTSSGVGGRSVTTHIALPPPSPALALPLTPPLNTEELPRSLATLERLLVLKTLGSSKNPAEQLSRDWPHKHVTEWRALCDSLRHASSRELVAAVETFCEQELRGLLQGMYPVYRERRRSWIETVLG